MRLPGRPARLPRAAAARRTAVLRDGVRARHVAEDLVRRGARLHRGAAAAPRARRAAGRRGAARGAQHRPGRGGRRRRADACALAQAAAGRAHRHAPEHAGGRMPASACSPTPKRTCARARGWPRCTRPTGWPPRCTSPGSCAFSLDELRYEYPEEIVPAGHTPTSWLRQLTEEGVQRRFPAGMPAAVRATLEARAGADRAAEVRALLPHRGRHRALGARAGHPVPGPRQRGQLGGLLLPGRDRGGPAPRHAAVRALHQRRAQRAARHRHRLRAPAPRRGHPVHLPQVRPPPRRAHRRGHQLPAAHRRCATWAARWASTSTASTRWPRASSGSTAARSRPSACARTASTPNRPVCRLWVELTQHADRLPAPPEPAPGRLRHRARRPGAPGAGGERRHGRAAASSSGTRTTSTRWA